MTEPMRLVEICSADGDALDYPSIHLLRLPAVPRVGDDVVVKGATRRVTRVLLGNSGIGVGIQAWTESLPARQACPNCGSQDLTWSAFVKSTAPVAVNRLNTGDVSAQFALGCEECSETVKIVSAQAVAAVLNEQGIDVSEVE
jgi:hypothetical protein